MKYKLIACDLDGTLLNDNSHISQSKFDSISKICGKGVMFVPVTGRTLYEIPQSLLKCEYVNNIVYSDGAVIYSKDDSRVLSSCYIKKETAFKVLNILKEYETMIELYEGGHPVTEASKINEKSYEYFNIDKNYRPVIDKTRIGVESLEQLFEMEIHIEIFNVFFKFEEQRNECFERLGELSDIILTTSMDNNIEIMSSHASKGAALEKLCDILQITSDEIIALGDSKNDISMFSFAKTAVAPSNASPALSAFAEIASCSNNENLMQYILKNYIKDNNDER